MTAHEMIASLLSIKLKGKARLFVLDAQKRLKSSGHLDATYRRHLKQLYSSHEKTLREAQEARERARVALMRERLGLSHVELAGRTQKPDPEDLGF